MDKNWKYQEGRVPNLGISYGGQAQHGGGQLPPGQIPQGQISQSQAGQPGQPIQHQQGQLQQGQLQQVQLQQGQLQQGQIQQVIPPGIPQGHSGQLTPGSGAVGTANLGPGGGPSGPSYYPSQLGIYNYKSPVSNEDSKPRMRVSRACDRCRTQKIKCSGTHPCVNCTKQKKDCNYSTTFTHHVQPELPHQTEVNFNEPNPNFVAKRQKVILGSVEPFGLPVISKSKEQAYISHLENRVQYLEGLLSDNSRNVFKSARNNEPDITEQDRILISPSNKWRYSRRHQNILVVELCRSMYANLSGESQLQVKLPRTQYFGWNLSGCKYLTPEELPAVPEVTMDTERLVNIFFTEVNPLYSILHETVFREQILAYDALLLEELTANDSDSKTHQTRLFSALLHLVYALAIRFSEFPKQKGPDFELLKLEEVYFKYAYKVISILSFEWESFELIQSWLLITLYLRVCHRQTSSYHALGQAVFMSKSMGLEQAVPPLTTSTNYERLKAKRIYWCVYSMDRVLGLQTGRYCGLTDEDRVREFPTFDERRDNWLTLESFAMLHLARIANYVHTMGDDNPDVVKYQQINLELTKMRQWLNENGFSNDDLYNKKQETSNLGCKVQVKLHYYDLLMCVHGKLMFNYIGRRVASHGLRIELVLEACHGVVELMDKSNKHGGLYTPWYMVLLLLFNVGVYAITMINGGVFAEQCRKILQKSIKLIGVLKNAPVRNELGKIIFRERFKMAKECLWALKMANRILILKLREDIKALSNIGIDHGSSDVNKQMFTQLGVNKEGEQTNELSQLLDRQKYREDEYDQEEVVKADPSPEIAQSEVLNNGDYDVVDNLLGNLQWFDKWLDVEYDF